MVFYGTRFDDAGVVDVVTQQGDIAALGCVDGALVDNTACVRATEGDRVAGVVKRRVVEVERGGNQAADVDLCPLTKDDAIRVDQEYLSVGVQVSEYLAAVGIEDAVDCNGGSRGLQEVDGLCRADVEALPVEGEVLAGLVDGGGGTRLGDVACA